MRKIALVITLVAAAAAFTWANAATVAYKATLGGAAEVPPVQTAGKGAARGAVTMRQSAPAFSACFVRLTASAVLRGPTMAHVPEAGCDLVDATPSVVS